MTTAPTTPPNVTAVSDGDDMVEEILLNPGIHGESRVPGLTAPVFDLSSFGWALEQGDVDYQLARYAPDADILIVDPDNPPAAPQTVHGTPAVRAWLLDAAARHHDRRITHLVDGGNRIAFSERWRHEDGTDVVATSTAELEDGLITTQHTLLAWRRSGS